MTVPILVGVTIVIFLTIKIIPGDPVASMLGPTGTPEARAALTERLGLNGPLPVQYLFWLFHLAQGDLGTSLARQSPVLPLVTDAFVNTLILTAFAAVLAFVLGIGLGATAALRRGRIATAINNGVALFCISTPQYTIGLVLIIYLASGTGWFPVSGMQEAAGTGGWGGPLWHLLLPGGAPPPGPARIIAPVVPPRGPDVMSKDLLHSFPAPRPGRVRDPPRPLFNTP